MEWFCQIALAIQHCHARKILHRDLKLQNIYICSDGRVKLGDFGISKLLDSTMDLASTVVGTPYSMSPEVCQSNPYSYMTDIWALGCILFELCTTRHPFTGNGLLALVRNIVQEPTPEIPAHFSRDLQQLIKYLCSREEEMANRYSGEISGGRLVQCSSTLLFLLSLFVLLLLSLFLFLSLPSFSSLSPFSCIARCHVAVIVTVRLLCVSSDMLAKDPAKRPSISEVCARPIVRRAIDQFCERYGFNPATLLSTFTPGHTLSPSSFIEPASSSASSALSASSSSSPSSSPPASSASSSSSPHPTSLPPLSSSSAVSSSSPASSAAVSPATSPASPSALSNSGSMSGHLPLPPHRLPFPD